MAAFPTVNWSWQTNRVQNFGQNNVVMEDGTPYSQTFFSTSNRVNWKINHLDLTDTEVTTVRDFLRTNAALEFSITDPLESTTYNGRLASGLNVQPKRGDRFDCSWNFVGTEQ